MTLKVMISSVRRGGLGPVRDAVAPVIEILGYEVVRFEDRTPAPVPSRAVCVDMVKSSDIYLLLLGAEYGDPMSDTGLAPTAEEWTVARNLGKPTVVFKKSGVTPLGPQADFIAEVEAYPSGVFRGSFANLPELLAKVGPALAEAASRLQPFRPAPITRSVLVPWIATSPRFGAGGTILATYVLPMTSSDRLRIGDAATVQRALARAGRDSGLFEEGDALAFPTAEDGFVAQADDQRRPAAGVSVGLDRSVTIWAALPQQTLGTVYDEAVIADRITRDLRLAASLPQRPSGEVAIAISLDGTTMLGRSNGPNSMTLPFLGQGDRQVRLEPADAVAADTLPRVAPAVAVDLTARLSRRLERR